MVVVCYDRGSPGDPDVVVCEWFERGQQSGRFAETSLVAIVDSPGSIEVDVSSGF